MNDPLEALAGGGEPAPPAPGRTAGGGRPRPLRHRLLLALVGISTGSVLLAGLITVAFAREASRSAAVTEMRRSLASVAEAERAGEAFPTLVRLQRLLRLQGIGLVVVNERGGVATVATGPLGRRFPGQPFDRRNLDLDAARAAAEPDSRGRLPAGVEAGDLDVDALYRGEVDTGGRGGLVFVAQPLAPKNAGVPVLVATRRVVLFAGLGRVLVGAAALAALAAAGLSVLLVRRLTRPLAAMERTARAIAGGDLEARVEGLGGADDELAALGAAIDGIAAELHRAQGLERAFLMSVSHDLRTPLTSIRGYAEALTEGAADDDVSRRRAALIIGAEAGRLERLVADLLDLARLDARAFSLRPRPVDAAAVVAAAVEALQPAAADAGLRLAVAVPTDSVPTDSGAAVPVEAVLDPERLGQVVANLVENALRYATTAVDVEVRAPAPGARAGRITVTVADDGPGIDPDDRPHVFERLYTSRREQGRKVGTGLGLAIVRELTAAMGGSVQLEPAPGGGTRFSVSVPGSPVASSTSTSAGSSS